ncbi:MAG TPA: hypothetical protein VLM38_18660 [Blastocatellia bacterium]|nr:hypothetical protein [Blastocatellia bacterium]
MTTIRFLRSFAWMRWRLLINSIKGGRRRDAVERLSRLAAVLVPALVVLFSIILSLVFSVLGGAGGWAAGSGTVQQAVILLIARIILLCMLAVVLFVPLAAPARGAIGGYRRLLLLPISRRVLHLIEMIACAADPWLVFVIPGILFFAMGLLIAQQVFASIIALAAGMTVIVVYCSLFSLMTFLVNWLMLSRRRGELFTLAFVLGFSLLGLIPAFLSGNLDRRSREARTKSEPRERFSVDKLDDALPIWTRVIPSELYGRAIGFDLEGSHGIAWICVGGLAAEAAILYRVSAAMHGKLLDSVESSGVRRTSRRRIERLPLPGLSQAAAAVAFAQARSGLRSVRGRLIVFMTGPLVAAMALVSRRAPEAVPGGSFLGSDGYVALGAGIVFSLYAMQAFTMNQFASDRAALTLEFLAPISDEDLVRGKTAGCAMMLGVTVSVCLVCSLIVGPGGSPLLWLSVLLGGAASYMLLSPVATFLSAVFPAASDLSKTGTGGNPHGFAFLVGSLMTIVISGITGMLIALGRSVFESTELTLLLMALWTILAGAVSIPLLRLAARAVSPRRENLALVAQGR